MEQIWSKLPTFANVNKNHYHTDIYDNKISNPHFRKVQANRFGIHSAAVVALQGRHCNWQVPRHEDYGQSEPLDSKNQQIKSRIVCDEDMRQHVDGEVKAIRRFFEDAYQHDRDNIDKNWPKLILDKYYNPSKYKKETVDEKKTLLSPIHANASSHYI